MLKRLTGRLRSREPRDLAAEEAARAQAAQLKDEQITNRTFVRFGPRNTVPERPRDE